MKDVYSHIRQLIAEGKLGQALTLLAAKLTGTEQTEVIILQSQLSQLERSERIGSIGFSDANIVRSRISDSTLKLAHILAKQQKNREEDTNSDLRQKKNLEYYKAKRLFFSYSKSDRTYVDQFLRHLAGLRRMGKIEAWDDSQIQPGDNWDGTIRNELAMADIILLLISADFIATDYVWGVEIKEAMARHDQGNAIVIPIILRPCRWTGLPFGRLQGLPSKGTPISTYPNVDQAWTEVVEGLERIL